MNKLPLITIAVGIILTAFAPYIFTHFSSCLYFGRPNEIGDTIGGITSPIIGIMGTILVYLTFEQQNKAIQQPLDAEKKRLTQIRKIIYLNLENVIIPSLKEYNKYMKDGLISFKSNTLDTKINYNINLTASIYNSIDKIEMFEEFGEDINTIAYIYETVGYIKSKSISYYYSKLLKIKTQGKDDQNITKLIEIEFKNIEKDIKVSKKLINTINTFIEKSPIHIIKN